MKEKYTLTEAQLKQIIYETIEASLNEGKFGRALGTAALGAAMALGGCKGNTEPNTVPPTHMVQQTPSQIDAKEYSEKYTNFNSPIEIVNRDWRKPDLVPISQLYHYIDTLFQRVPYSHTVDIKIEDSDLNAAVDDDDNFRRKWKKEHFGYECYVRIETTIQYSQKTKLSAKRMFDYFQKAMKNDTTYQYMEMEGGYRIQYHAPNEYFPIYTILIKDKAFKISGENINGYLPPSNLEYSMPKGEPLTAAEIMCYPGTITYFKDALTGEVFKTKGTEWDFE